MEPAAENKLCLRWICLPQNRHMANSRANEYLNGGLFSEPRPRPSSQVFWGMTLSILLIQCLTDIVTDFWRGPRLNSAVEVQG